MYRLSEAANIAGLTMTQQSFAVGSQDRSAKQTRCDADNGTAGSGDGSLGFAEVRRQPPTMQLNTLISAGGRTVDECGFVLTEVR